jgi:hypothetical protein
LVYFGQQLPNSDSKGQGGWVEAARAPRLSRAVASQPANRNRGWLVPRKTQRLRECHDDFFAEPRTGGNMRALGADPQQLDLEHRCVVFTGTPACS